MKKIIFFSLEDGWLGGVARVNLALEPALKKEGFRVQNLFLRGCDWPQEEKEENTILRENYPWNFIDGGKILTALKEKKFGSALSLLFRRLRDEMYRAIDFRKAKAYFRREAPDCIVVSNYYLLDAIPKEYYSRTLHHVHTSFAATMAAKANRETILRYNKKIGFLWLSREICKKAEEEGFENCFFVYNPVTSFPEERSVAEESRTVTLITRFSEEKRVPLAIHLIQKSLDRLPDPTAYHVDLYGTGPEEELVRQAIGEDSRFSLHGYIRDPYVPLQNSRLSINTSSYEGFSISILEAAASGVPTVAFSFGEAAEEEIEHGKTGFLIPMDDNDAFVEALVRLFSDDALCHALSLGARQFAKSFCPDAIVRDWTRLLSHLPLDKSGKA